MRLLVIVVIILCAALVPGSGEPARRSSWLSASAAERSQIEAFCQPYKAYLNEARTAELSTRAVVKFARQAGFVDFHDAGQVKPGARLMFVNRQRAIVLAVIGSEPMTAASRLVAAHHDSPHIDLKGRPVVAAADFAIFKTIYYGSLKKYQWANIPLALVGRVDTSDGRTIDVSVGLRPSDPVFVIADNAPHSDTELRTRTYTGVLTGEELDPVAGSIPDAKNSVVDDIVAHFDRTWHLKPEDLMSAELQLVPAAPPADVGMDRGLIGAYGQDDRLSSYCAVRALLDLQGTPKRTALCYLSNFEEVGSVNNTGAASRFLSDTYAELTAAQRGDHYSDLDLRHALRNAEVISADCTDGVNPIFPQSSEPTNAARLGHGVAFKMYGRGFNAPSEYIARVRALFDAKRIPWQTQTPKVDVGGGGTIGGFMSAEGMLVIDLGVPLLSMHSPFEMSSKIDVWNLYRGMAAFYGQ